MLETPQIYPWREKFWFILFCWPDTHFSNAESNIVIYQSTKIQKYMLGKSHSFENLVKQEIMKVGQEECSWYPQQSSWNNRDYSLTRVSAHKWALVFPPERWLACTRVCFPLTMHSRATVFCPGHALSPVTGSYV